MSTPVQRKLAALKRKRGLRQSQALSFEIGKGAVTRGVVIPDINHGAWSYIDQPYAPDYREKTHNFL